MYYAVYHARDYVPDARLTGDQRTARIYKLHFENGVINEILRLVFDVQNYGKYSSGSKTWKLHKNAWT